MNVTESTHVNTLARWLLRHSDAYMGEASENDARKALAHLCDRAYKRLWAGVTGNMVNNHWSHVLKRSPSDCNEAKSLERCLRRFAEWIDANVDAMLSDRLMELIGEYLKEF